MTLAGLAPKNRNINNRFEMRLTLDDSTKQIVFFNAYLIKY